MLEYIIPPCDEVGYAQIQTAKLTARIIGDVIVMTTCTSYRMLILCELSVHANKSVHSQNHIDR